MWVPLYRLGLALGAGLTAILIGGGLYLLVSYVVMTRHTPARSLWRALTSAFHEMVAIAVTQPLIPFFYVLGRRMGGTHDGRPVIFVHGYFQNRVDFLYLARAARKAKLGPLYGFNYSWLESIPSCAARLSAFVERVAIETGRPQVALVCHSLGGVVALEYLGTPDGAKRVEVCVTIASPHAGVTWRGGMPGRAARQLVAESEYMRGRPSTKLGARVVSIFSTHDNIVHPMTTSALTLRGGEDLTVENVGHLGILFSRKVAELTIAALR